ncbi:MAG: glycosyltransferase family 2 protein [Dehalococcoidia bacterium]|nr:glycosyltransferase family 2 protein [Dehalococcoidia bacterium]
MKKTRVLIASPIRQKPNILKEFLQSLSELDHGDLQVDYFFVDDNEASQSWYQLQEFKREGCNVHIETVSETKTAWKCDNETHHWNRETVDRVTRHKNKQIQYALKNKYDYIFFLDSDLVLHPNTLLHLLSLDLDIVSEIFWTQWTKDTAELPNIWKYDNYIFDIYEIGRKTQEESLQSSIQWVNQLRVPGVYDVGGLGACTLIKRRVLEQGVDFSRISNISFAGEDRHFCIRAVVHGFKLKVDTNYPCFHIYREEYLPNVEKWKERNRIWDKRIVKPQGNKLCLTMLVRNEANRYLREVLESAKKYIHCAVILDDASEDDTVKVCREVLNDIPLNLVSNQIPGFSNEIALRKQLWNLALESKAEWFLLLDADEIFEPKAEIEIPKLINQTYCDTWTFRLYDMWDESHYREDHLWNAHLTYRPFLIRYQPNFEYQWNETPLHCGRMPVNVTYLPTYRSDLKIKHLGWMTKEDRIKKYFFYAERDPKGEWGIPAQYQSILDKNPRLKLWEE